MRSAARPASTPPTGPRRRTARATSASPCSAPKWRCRRWARSTPEQRKGRFVAVICLAWPDGEAEYFRGEAEGTLVWPPRGDKRLRLRPGIPAGRADAHLRRDDRGGKARLEARPGGGAVASRPRLPEIRAARSWVRRDSTRRMPTQLDRIPASASMCTGRSARRSARIATSTAMSATSRSTRSALRAPSRPSLRPCASGPARAR